MEINVNVKYLLLNSRRLPARLRQEEAAPLLGVHPHDMPILARAKCLKPLGDPALNAVKYFASAAIEHCAKDAMWLDKATRVLSEHWAGQNAKRPRGLVPMVEAAMAA